MAHFAKVRDGLVVKVIVADQEFIDNMIDDSPGEWIQTSYNTRGGAHYDPETGQKSEDQSKALRYNFAGVGFIYDANRDAFYEQQPYPSWEFVEEMCIWKAPVPYPADGYYLWNEQIKNWTLIELVDIPKLDI
jgi:hypothetical protein